MLVVVPSDNAEKSSHRQIAPPIDEEKSADKWQPVFGLRILLVFGYKRSRPEFELMPLRSLTECLIHYTNRPCPGFHMSSFGKS